MTRTGSKALAALILVIAIGGATVLLAQTGAFPTSAVATASADVGPGAVRLLVGRSAIVDVGTTIARVSLTSSDIADALVTSPEQLLINGKMPGTISLFVWDRGGALRRYEVVVQRDLARLSEQMRELFPNDRIDVQSNGKNVVLSGTVSSKDVIDKAVSVAAGYVDKRDEVVPLLQLQASEATDQVLLRVRFAEVTRSAISDLGASLFTGADGYKNVIGRSTTQQFGDSLPNFEDGKLVFSDFLNLFFFDAKNQLGAVIKALQTRGQFQTLAEPNLVAESGKEASFLAGGEFPIPVAQGSGANMAISVMFKEFGIRLNFTPTVNGDRVHLKVRPEVSSLDFGNAVVLNGFRIPALITRRTETELELQNGQTFAIAGLMNNSVASTMRKIPGIGDIPILGLLFKSKAAQKDQTELVVMITPEILRRNSPGVTPNLPRNPEPFLAPLPQTKTVAPPAPAFSAARSGSAPVSASVAAVPAPQSTASDTQLSPAAAAAIVSNLIPPGPRLQDSQSSATSATASTPAPAAARPLTDREIRTIERVRREEQDRQQKIAREEAKRAAENARRDAERR